VAAGGSPVAGSLSLSPLLSHQPNHLGYQQYQLLDQPQSAVLPVVDGEYYTFNPKSNK